MKVNIFLNNQLFNPISNKEVEVENIKLSDFKKAIEGDHLYILRGEPTKNEYLHDILHLLEEKNYILTTSLKNPEFLFRYEGKIPYISINYFGFYHDCLNKSDYFKKLNQTLRFFTGKNTTLRINYILTEQNKQWLKTDIEILRRLMQTFPNMKQPYITLYQKAHFFKEERFHWPSYGREDIDLLNKAGLLTKKNLDFLTAWLNKEEYICVAPQNELVLDWKGVFRTCMSHRFVEALGSIKDYTLQDFIKNSEEARKSCELCFFRNQCWLYHFKDNINYKKRIG